MTGVRHTYCTQTLLALLLAGVISVLGASAAFGQVLPLADSSLIDPEVRAGGWLRAGAPNAAEQELARALGTTLTSGHRADLMFLLVQTALDDQSFEEAFQWTNTFLSEYPTDERIRTVWYFRGVSAFQTNRLDTARAVLDRYLRAAGSSADDGDHRGSAFFWRAMCALERSRWTEAENDFRTAYEDSAFAGHRDDALLGWSIALERRGDVAGATRLVERMLSEFPGSEYTADARIRLASLSLRQGRAQKTLDLLEGLKLPFRSQREENLLLRAEANLDLGAYGNAEGQFLTFLKDFPASPYARRATSGLAFTYLRRGVVGAAQVQFDSLALTNDSLGNGALYQSAVLALLGGRANDAAAKLELLVDRSPYDAHADKAYWELGMIQYRSKRYREARRNFQIVARLFPESPLRLGAFRMQGESNMAIGDFSNAQYAFAQVRKLNASDSLTIPAMYQEGIALYHLGRFKSSAERFAEFLKLYPKDPRLPELQVWRAEALYQDGRYEEAERAYSDALRAPKNPRRADASYGLAWTLFEQKKFARAASAFDTFSKEYPQSEHVVDASLRKADCYFFMREYDKASALYASLATVKANSRYAEYAAFQLAMSYIQRGESQRGIEQLRSFLEKFPSSIYNEVVQFNIGWTMFSQEQYTPALLEFRTLVREYPESQLLPRVFFNMGDAFYNLQQYDSSRVYYQLVLERFPESPLVKDAMNGLQYAYEAEGKPEEALAAIETLLKTNPTGTSEEDLLLKKGDILFGQGDFPGAIQEYERLLATKPSRPVHALALRQIGRIYELENNIGRAVTYYEQIDKNFSDMDIAPSVTLTLGLAQMKMKRFQDAAGALTDFDKRYANSPLISEAQYQLAVALSNLKKKDEALAQFRRIITEHPDDVFADRSRLQIALMHQERKEYQAAIDTLDSLVARRSDDLAAEALIQLGDTYLFMKRPADALQAYKDVVDQYGEFPLLVERARLGMGAAYASARDRKNARAIYEDLSANAADPNIRKEAGQRLKELRR